MNSSSSPELFSEKKSKTPKIIFFLILCALLGFFIWKINKPEAQAPKGDRSIPVKTGTAKLQNVPYYLSGLGTVLSPNQVTIRAQVDGELTAIHFTEGQTVNKGDLLAEIDARPFQAALKQTKAQKANIQAQLSLAQLQLERSAKLLKDDAVSQQEVDQQAASVAQLKASIESADADIEAATVKLGYTKIVSPLTGRVGIRHVDTGNIISASDMTGLVTITQIDPIEVLFTLPQNALSQIDPNNVKLPVAVFDKDGGKMIAEGSLETIDNQIDAATGTIKLKALFENKSGTLWPGQHVTARLQRQIQENALVIPVQALQIGLDNNFVYRVKADESVEVVPITTLFQDQAIAVIGEGLKENDIVVTDGQMRLTNGAKITTAEKKPDDQKDNKKRATDK